MLLTRRFYAHPLMFFDKTKPFSFVLLVPVLKGVFQYVVYKRVSGILSLGVFALFIVFVLGFLEYKSFSLILKGEAVVIKSGFLLKKTSFLDTTNISGLFARKNLLDMAFSAVTCGISYEGGKNGKTDFNFRLRKKDFEVLEKTLFKKVEKEGFYVAPFRIALWSAATSSAFGGLVIGVPIVNKLGNLLGLALNETLFAEINEISNSLSRYMPPVINMVTLLFIIGYSIGFVFEFFKNLNFSVKLSENAVKIEKGLFERRRTVFKKSAANSVLIQQSFLMRFVNGFYISANLAGAKENKTGTAVLIPFARYLEAKSFFEKTFFFLKDKTKESAALKAKGNFYRFIYLPLFWTGLGIVAFLVFAVKLQGFRSAAFGFLAVFLLFMCYFFDLCIYNYKEGRLILGDAVMAISSKGLKRCEFYCKKEKIGQIVIKETFADRRHKTCKVRLYVSSEKGESVKVRNLDKKEALKTIKKNFKFDE